MNPSPPTRTAAVTRCEALLAARGTVDPDLIMRVWEEAYSDPATRAEARVLAPPVVRALRRRAATLSAPPEAPQVRERARGLAARVAASAGSSALRAELRLEALLSRLDAGEAVDVASLHEETAPALDVAAAALEAGPDEDLARAVRLLTGVLGALMHRTLHCEDLDSPLSAEPTAFLGPLRASVAYRRLTAPGAPRRRPGGPGAPAVGPARRVLLVTSGNQHFSGDVEERVEAAGGEVRRLDIVARPDGLAPVGFPGLVAERLARTAPVPPAGSWDGVASTEPRPGSEAADQLAWADVVFVDWCLEGAVWASLHVPQGTRLVVRLHSVEALSVQPHAVDWHAVDDLVFVSEHLRALGTAVLPLPPNVRVHVVGLMMRLDRFMTDKAPGADRTLALVGWAQTVKDPIWALDVLDILRERDSAWRLLLVGRDFPDSLTARAWEYRYQVEERLASPGLTDAVVRTGHVDDLPTLFRDVGVILSTSRREGVHVGLLEGLASGALPVVRNWPLTAPWGGPLGFVPQNWVVRTPHEAAERILAGDGDAEARAEAATWVRARYDQPVVAPALDDVLGLRPVGPLRTPPPQLPS
ncbi:MAG: glycosyltransferase [Kineosporiaceae bacterium]